MDRAAVFDELPSTFASRISLSRCGQILRLLKRIIRAMTNQHLAFDVFAVRLAPANPIRRRKLTTPATSRRCAPVQSPSCRQTIANGRECFESTSGCRAARFQAGIGPGRAQLPVVFVFARLGAGFLRVLRADALP